LEAPLIPVQTPYPCGIPKHRIEAVFLGLLFATECLGRNDLDGGIFANKSRIEFASLSILPVTSQGRRDLSDFEGAVLLSLS